MAILLVFWSLVFWSLVAGRSHAAQTLPDDPTFLKALIAVLQAEHAKLSATLRVHDQLIQTQRLRIAKLKKQAFGQPPETIERETEQLALALAPEDLLIAAAESGTAVLEDTEGAVDRPSPGGDSTSRERQGLDPGSWLAPRLRW